MGYIYKITNNITGKCYIGETAKEDPEIRWNQHKGTIRRGVGCPALRDAVNKYGIDNFKFEVLVICFDDNRFDMEKLYIKKYNSQVPNGYNISAGGMGGSFTGRKHTPETMARIIETTRLYRQNNPDWFEKYREKHREVMSKVDTGAAVKNSKKFQLAKAEGRVGGAGKKYKENSDEIKEKIRQGVLRYYEKLNNSGNVPNKVNIEKHRKSMAKAVGIKLNKYDDNDNLIDSYNSIKGAARESNISYSTLSMALKHNRKAGGFIWKKMPKEESTL
jgi:group I intron endonuclease